MDLRSTPRYGVSRVGLKQELLPLSSSTAPGTDASAGWDPYEVWRTRILLPRLASESAKPVPFQPTLKVVSVVPSADPIVAKPWVQAHAADESARRAVVHAISVLLVAVTGAILSYADRQRQRYL
jgi:hypothetical protein